MDKKFSELTHEEIMAMSEEEYRNVSPFEKHGCYDCAHLKAVLSWWCMNDEAVKYRGTRFPGIIKCNFWAPDWKYIDDKYKTPENGYVSKKQIIIKKLKNIYKKIIH